MLPQRPAPVTKPRTRRRSAALGNRLLVCCKGAKHAVCSRGALQETNNQLLLLSNIVEGLLRAVPQPVPPATPRLLSFNPAFRQHQRRRTPPASPKLVRTPGTPNTFTTKGS